MLFLSRLPEIAAIRLTYFAKALNQLTKCSSHSQFAMAQRYLEPSRGGVLLDVSCGSGLFSRRFASSGVYSAVVASDFSETMLTQTSTFMAEDRSLLNEYEGVEYTLMSTFKKPIIHILLISFKNFLLNHSLQMRSLR